MISLRRTLVAALMLCAALGNRGWAAEDAANPMQLPKTILALRGDETDRTQLRIVFDRTRDGETVAPITAWIGADYVALIDGKRMTITDLRLRRRFVVDEEAGTLVNLSLYGDVMFRRVELVRRMEIAAVLTKDHSDVPQSFDPFWIESELGITGVGKQLEAAPHQDGDTTVFNYAGQQIAWVTPSDTAVPSDVDHAYGTFVHTLPFHPSIARWLSANGQVPKRLDFISEARGKTEKISLRLRTASAQAADFPIPSRLSVVLLPWGGDDPDVGLLHEILPRMGEAMTARADREKGVADDRAAIAADFKDGHKFAAALRLTELALRWGRSAAQCDPVDAAGPCLTKTEIDRELRGDPRSVAMFKASALQDHDPAKALAIWRDIDRSDVPNGYVVDVFTARLLSESGDRAAAAKAFAAAFAGDPNIVALYREVGDHFARASRLDLAWLCYDLGRALPNREPPDALTGIDDIEQQLAAHYPDLF